MYYKQLRTFLRVAELGSFSRAAQALYITPSAVIQQINSFERDVGLPLFVRGNQGVCLTEAGKIVYEEGKILIARGVALRQRLEALRCTAEGELTLGVQMLRKARLFNQLWQDFSAQQPGCRLNIRHYENRDTDLHGADLVECIQDLTFLPSSGQDWEFLPVCSVPLMCALSRNHPLASRQKLTFDDLRQYGLMTICSTQEPVLNALLEDARQRGVPLITVENYDLSTFAQCELHGHVLQLPQCWQDLYPSMVVLPCDWPYELNYGFYHHRQPSHNTRVFLDYLRRRMEQQSFTVQDILG